METLVNGIQALNYSASQVIEDEQRGTRHSWTIGLTLVTAIGLGIGLFVVVPHLLSLAVGFIGPWQYDVKSFWFHLVDSVIKVAMFVGYLAGIAVLADIRRVFQYHGAEHKSIHAYEAGEALTVANAMKHSCLHPRCGTAFLLVVMVLSILVFSLVIPLLPLPSHWPGALRHPAIILVKIGLMLPIAAASYEFIKWSGRHQHKRWVGALCQPGLWLQRLTTREPTPDQVEVALQALCRALQLERQQTV
jgi:uncharacterized protein YqhQ